MYEIDYSSLSDKEYNDLIFSEIYEAVEETKTPEFEAKALSKIIAPNSLAQELAVNNLINDVTFGGAVGGGKTFVLLLRITFMIKYCRDIRVEREKKGLFTAPPAFLIVRKELPGLKDLIKTSHMFFGGMGEFKVSDKMWQLNDGITITFGFIRDEKSFTKYQGLEYTGIYIDEAGQYSTKEFENIELLKSRLRNTAGYPSDFMMTANPGDKGHNYLVKKYNIGRGQEARINKFYKGELIDETHELYNVDVNEVKELTMNAFIPSSSADNPAIDSSYVDMLRNSSMPQYMKDALIDGLWIVKAGGMFEDLFDDNIHVLNTNFTKIPNTWKFTRGYDYGLSAPYASVIFAENNGIGDLEINGVVKKTPVGTKVVVDEDYRLLGGEPNRGDRSTTVEHAQRLIALQNEVMQRYEVRRIEAGYADSAIFTGEEGSTTADIFASFGLPFLPCSKGLRSTGWMKLRTMLKNTIDHKEKEDLDVNKPCIYFMSICEHSIRTIKEVQRDTKNNNGDLIKNEEDHLLDVIRYNTHVVPKKKNKKRRRAVGL